MHRISRRAVLSVGLGTLAGIGGVAAQPDGQGPGQGRGEERGRGQRRQDDGTRACPPGTTLLDRFEVHHSGDEAALEHVEGDGDVTIEAVEHRGAGRVASAEWTSATPVALVEVYTGQTVSQFDGGFEGRVEVEDGPAVEAVDFCAPRGGRAVAWDVDDTGPFRNVFHRAAPGDERDPTRVVHVRTENPETETRDYAHASVDVLRRRAREDWLRVGALTDLSVEYYQGSDDAGVVPDGVFAWVLPPEDEDAPSADEAEADSVRAPTDDEEGDEGIDAESDEGIDEGADGRNDDRELHVAFRRVDAAGGAEWRTFDVLEALQRPAWRVVPVSPSDLRTGAGAAQVGLQLRDEPARTDVAVAEEYADATLAGVGVGAGSSGFGTTVDRYYGDLSVAWEGGSDSYAFPVSEQVEVVLDGAGGVVTATLSLDADRTALSLADVDPESVTLAGLEPIAPPVAPGLRASEEDVDAVAEDELRVSFPRGRFQPFVNEVGSDRLVVHADVEGDDGSAIFGVGEWD